MLVLPKVDSLVPRLPHSFIQVIAGKLLSLMKWQVNGEIPNNKKFILAVAPHTSNWDFIIAVLVMLTLRLKVTFLGKNSIFIGPFGRILRKLGGLPVERSCPNGVVGQLVYAFEHTDSMVLGLAPEGTRSKTSQWKTGFLIIAQQANIPVVPVSLDFAKKQVSFLPARIIGDNITQELSLFKQQFNQVCAKNPQSVG
jgi:1-acyl-sn-glycerol-3-phosphate acyltransferase